MILAVLFIVLLKIYKHSHLHIPWLYAEITTINDCILLPIMRLPLCPTQCLVHGPSSITNLNVHGSCLSSTLKVRWPDFYVLNGVTGQKLKVPEKIKVSVFQHSKLKSLLNKSFLFIFILLIMGFYNILIRQMINRCWMVILNEPLTQTKTLNLFQFLLLISITPSKTA